MYRTLKLPKFDEYGHLHCPWCGETNLHLHDVAVYRREEEDDEIGLNVKVGKAAIDYSSNFCDPEDGNPSPRRDGVRIRFWCEHCGDDTIAAHLVLAEEKGHIYVEMQQSDELT